MKNELANLRKPSMTSSWRLKNLGVAAKKKKSEPKNKEKKFDDETKLEKAKLEQKLEKKIYEKRDQNINAKLPKLVITKFKGTPIDWLRLRQKLTRQTFHRLRSSPSSGSS